MPPRHGTVAAGRHGVVLVGSNYCNTVATVDRFFERSHNIEGADLAHKVNLCTAASPIQHPKIPENDGSPQSSMYIDCGLSSTRPVERCFDADAAVQPAIVLEVIDGLI